MTADPLHRHIAACNNTHLPGGRRQLFLAKTAVGWVDDAAAAVILAGHGQHRDGGVALADAAAIAPATHALVEAKLCRWRQEGFDLRATPDGPVLGQVDRGAVPCLGVLAQGVHLNGLVRRPDGLRVWVGVRAADKAVAPGKLDNLVAGGISAGLDPLSCLVKEAGEEAGIDPDLAAQARQVARLGYVMQAPEGLRRDVLHVFDLHCPPGFTPIADGEEVERFELWPARDLLAAVRDGDGVKFNVALVLIDLFLREGLVEDTGLRVGLNRFS